MALLPITEEQTKYINEDINFDDTQMQMKVEQVKGWIKKQPHLPHLPDEIVNKMIRFYLVLTKMSTEKTKRKIDSYYAIRHQIPEIFLKRDPTQQDIRDSVDRIRFFPLSELTPDGFRVNIISGNLKKDKRFSAADMKAVYKRLMAINDARILQGEFCRGEYEVYDCRAFHPSHITEMPWLLAQRITPLMQSGLPIRINAMFFIYTPAYMDTVINLVKPLFAEKLWKRTHIFQGDFKNLYPYIPQRILPSDFGGEAPSIEESSRAWQKTIESMRDFFLEDEKRVTDESKRPHDSVNTCGQTFGVNGTFTKLNID